MRLVSDTAVRRVSHDRAGNIIAILWSDGGNSVGHCQPTDVRRGIGRGCGLTTAGAGATSFAYLMRIEPQTYQAVSWTLWYSQWGRKANGAGIERTGEADDGSTCFAGGSAWGLRQTPNRLSASEPGGEYVAVLTPDLSGARYASIVPGAGMAQVGDGCSWGIATGSPGGKGAGAGAVPDGTVVEFSPTVPKWVTADAEFRHPDPVRFWPNFFYGRPVSGRIAWPSGKPSGSFVITCDQLVQPRGEHDRRILGEVSVSAWFSLTGRDLGMKGRAKDETFDVRISADAMHPPKG